MLLHQPFTKGVEARFLVGTIAPSFQRVPLLLLRVTLQKISFLDYPFLFDQGIQALIREWPVAINTFSERLGYCNGGRLRLIADRARLKRVLICCQIGPSLPRRKHLDFVMLVCYPLHAQSFGRFCK